MSGAVSPGSVLRRTGIGRVVFDCDGVLVASEEVIDRSWRRWAARYGCDPDAVLRTVSGRRAVDVVAAFLPDAEHAAAVALIDAFELEDAAEVRSVPGAADLLASMPADRWAVVTSGTRALATARLRASGLPMPGLFITADDVRRGKPDPEGYRRAIVALGGDPAAVVEDSRSGIDAGRAAGADLIVGVGAPTVGYGADVTVADLVPLLWEADQLSLTPAV